ncbi:MAG: hypothetical protein LBV42_05275 [Methanobrevibacter sp.]|jgi:hypothetical protein|nr:hypothetical protein [Methanobrevibacter sp.]
MNILKRNFKLGEKIGICLFVLSIFLLLNMLAFGLNQALWWDECFTLNLMPSSFMDMILITAYDVHPPLYYINVYFQTSFTSTSYI